MNVFILDRQVVKYKKKIDFAFGRQSRAIYYSICLFLNLVIRLPTKALVYSISASERLGMLPKILSETEIDSNRETTDTLQIFFRRKSKANCRSRAKRQ